MNLIDAINEHWDWTGLSAVEVRAKSPMGHLVIADAEERLFYLDPDGMEIIPLGSQAEAKQHFDSDEVRELWSGGALVALAKKLLGEAPEGSVYTLKPHSMVAGEYAPENMCILPLHELIAFSGDLARQLKDLPDGAQIKFRVVD